MKQNTSRWILSLLMSVATVLPAQAGVIIDLENVEGSGDTRQTKTGRLFLDGEQLKLVADTGDPNEAEIIYQGQQRRVLIVDHSEKNYMSIDEEAIQEIAAMMQGMQAQMEQALSQLPPEQRAQAEAMMKQRMPGGGGDAPVIEVVALDKQAKHDGKPCRGYEVRYDGVVESRIWATDWKNVGIDKQDFGAFVSMVGFFQQMMASLPTMAQGAAPDLFTGLGEIEGFPVLVETFEDGKPSGESHLRNARREKLDASTFTPPKGYSEQSMREGMQSGR